MNEALYPPRMVPIDLLEETRGSYLDWSFEAARRNFELEVRTVDDRVALLLEHFDEELLDDPAITLDRLGRKLADSFATPRFSYPDEGRGVELTDQGYNMAVDMGLLVAKTLLTRFPTLLRWELDTNPASEHRNSAVIRGWGDLQMEPESESIRLARLVASTQLSGKAWLHMFERWRTIAENANAGKPLTDISQMISTPGYQEMVRANVEDDATDRIPTSERTRLLQERDVALDQLQQIGARANMNSLDYSPDSLLALEKWYFEMYEAGSFDSIGVTRTRFEEWIAVYFAAVLVNHGRYR